MKKSIIAASLSFAVLIIAAVAMAAGTVTLKIKTEKEQVIIKEGKKVVKAVPTTKFKPEDTIIYTITYTNTTGEPVKDAIIDDPVPSGTVYIMDSAQGEGADITFSVDKGKSYNKPTLLFYQVDLGKGKKEQKTATPDLYTNIRWRIPFVPVNGSGKVSFKVRVQ